jgi:hypothetical protein
VIGDLCDDVEHHPAAAALGEAADVDELEAVVGEVGPRPGVGEAREARVVGQRRAQRRTLPQRLQLGLRHRDATVGQGGQRALPDGRRARSGGPDRRRDVVLGRDLLRHVLVHVVDEPWHERPQGGEEREQLGVVDVDDDGPQLAHRLEDRRRMERALRGRAGSGRCSTPWASKPSSSPGAMYATW